MTSATNPRPPQQPAEPKADDRIGIVGAGIAGLVLGIRLAEAGRRVLVMDARASDRLITEGAFLTLAPNGMNGLRPLGLRSTIAEAGLPTTAIEIRDEDGRRLALIDQSDHAVRFGAASVTLSRGELLGQLLDAARRAGVELRLGQRVVEVEAAADGVRVICEDGTRQGFDLLAACDGLRSCVRQAVFPDYPEPRPTGLIGTGGLIEVAGIAPTQGTMRMTFGRDAFFGYMKEGNGPVYWFNSYPADAGATPQDPARYAELLRRLHRTDPEDNRRILAALAEVERDYPIHAMPPLPIWHRGRVVLVGDAAHAVGPHAGQGASMAIEDGLVLADELLSGKPCAAAFAAYEARRRPRIERVVAVTERNGSQKRASTWAARFLRRLLLPIFIPLGARAQRQILAYRVDQDIAAAAPARRAA